METINKKTMGGFSIRAAAFARVANMVHILTKDTPTPAFNLGVGFLDLPDEVQLLYGVIMQQNAGLGACAELPSQDAELMAKVVMCLVLAFVANPSVFAKIQTCTLAELAGNALTGSYDERRNARRMEVLEAAKLLNNLGKEISGLEVVPSAEINKDGSNDYLTFLVTEA